MRQPLMDSLRDLYTGEVVYEPIGTEIGLCSTNLKFAQDRTLESRNDPQALFQLGFCLEGGFRWKYPDFSGKEMILEKNASHIQYGTVERSTSMFSADHPLRSINIILGTKRFENLVSCFRCKAFFDDLPGLSVQSTQGIPPKVRMILEQIEQCDISCELRNIYLEGKILELLALYFDEVVCQMDVTSPKDGITKEDYACLLKAKEILDRQYADPLTISALAHQVCLNEYKLKRGFKHCFGATILEYIVKKRMDMANQLLSEGNQKVKDIAWRVGYAKPSHFIDTYKKHYGVTPGQILRHSS